MKSIDDRAVVQTAEKGFKSIRDFMAKINNDWVFSLASGIAFNLLVATIPIIIAMISLAGFIFGGLDPNVKQELIQRIQNAFPPPIPSEDIVSVALDSLNKSAGLLGIIAVFGAVFAGSGLFVTMEGYFDIIYRRPPRGLIQQYLMAVGMIFLFVALTPLMIFADSFPSLIYSILQAASLSQIPGNGLMFDALGIISGLFVSWVLIEAMYIIVPNQHMSFRKSWFGALLAAVALQVYLVLFPFYVTHFLSSYTGAIGLAVILLFFFYYFAVILLIGAEVNAFFAEGIRALPDNLAGMIHDLTTPSPANGKDTQEQTEGSQSEE
jgi:membrane protein